MNIHAIAQRGILALTLATGIGGVAVTGVHAGGGGPRPDLAVQHTTPSAAGRERITIGNIGDGYAPPFRVAVLAGADSYSFTVSGMQAHSHATYTLPPLACGQPVAVIVDVDKQAGDTNYANNGTGFDAGCPIDGGPVLVPADN